MGRKMGVRGRPGLLFLILIIIFIIVFILTWRSMSSSEKPEVKDIFSSEQIAALHHRKDASNAEQHPALSDLQTGGNGMPQQDSLDVKGIEDHLRQHYVEMANGKSNNKDGTSERKINESPLSALLHPETQKISSDVPNCKPTVEQPPYYQDPDPSLHNVLDSMERLVHLDLKGAPPKLNYYHELFPLLNKLGATGLLIEYEDTFPYSGDLKNISAVNSYTSKEIEEIIALASENKLSLIPIIQTFGHMEFVLKSINLKDLRESEHTPQVINVASDKSYELISNMVKQILAAHPSIKYLHIGCDEVYEIGKGKSADIMIKERVGTEHLFVRHVKRVAEIVSKESNGKVRPIIWDDELRGIDESIISDSGLPSLVDIMVWKYTPNISIGLNETLWVKYAKLFKSVWAASSFKGATGARQFYTEPQYHIQNHFSWIKTIAKQKNTLKFKGIALTGWSRYDHFATLCELMPVAIPSLAVCLATLKHGGFNEEIHKSTSKFLDCDNGIQMSFPTYDVKRRKALVTQDCRFPGYLLYYGMQQLWGCRKQSQEFKEAGWLSEYQISHGFSNPGQLKVMAMRLSEQHSNYVQVMTPLQREMNEIYSDDTIEEWMDENINEQIHHIRDVQDKIKSLLSHLHWERRPLKQVMKMPVGPKVVPRAQSVASQPSGLRNINLKTEQKGISGQSEINRVVNADLQKQLPHAQSQLTGRLQQSDVQKHLASSFQHAGVQSQPGNPGSYLNNQLKPGQNGLMQAKVGSSGDSFKQVNSPHSSKVLGANVRGLQNPSGNTLKPVNKMLLKPNPAVAVPNSLGMLSNGRNTADLQRPLGEKKTVVEPRASDLSRNGYVKRQDTNTLIGKANANLLPESRLPVREGNHQSYDIAKAAGKSHLSINAEKLPSHNDNLILDIEKNAKIENADKLLKHRDLEQDPNLSKFHEHMEKENGDLDLGKEREGEHLADERRQLGNKKTAMEGYIFEEEDPVKYEQEDSGSLNPKFVEALRKSHDFHANQDSINKALFPDLTHESHEEHV